MKKLFLLIFYLSLFPAFSQKNISFKDSLDHKFDLSDWVIHAHGFIPVPTVITEPALGNIGGGLFAVFVDQNTPYRDSIGGKLVTTRVRPNLHGAGAAYTANGSWLGGGFSMGVIKKWKSNYRIGAAYADVNLNFYKQFPNLGERSFEFNIRTLPVFAQLTKRIGYSSWYAGLDYLFLRTELVRLNSAFSRPKEVNSLVSRLGIIVDYDSRDNIFTPNKGYRWNSLFAGSEDWLGSDYKYTSVNSALFAYWPVSPKLFSGLRLEYQQVFGDAPFYMKPYVSLRGIPVMRYQGNIVGLAETEWRWDFVPRFSLVAFGGTAKALQNDMEFNESDWRFSGGAGGRYLIARKLKLRTGIDVARGPEDWAYYLVFGTSWGR